jgi:hypothetical protein
MDFGQNNIGFSQTSVLHNSRVKDLGILASQYPYITSGCVCLWSFFGFGHGKDPRDGAGTISKWFVRQV